MPAHSKIVDEREVKKWFAEGRTYAWMVKQYLEKYNVKTTVSMWANYRRRNGLERRQVRDDDLIPWHVEGKHRWRYDVMMLRLEARRRAEVDLDQRDEQRLTSWLAELKEAKAVIHYDPETEEGFFWVPRPAGAKPTDLIREPERKTTKRRRAD
ncbi:hypothetical protein ACH5AU_31345 [Streptomyces albidoflavus]